jgi:Rieske Fe-S protein
MLLWDTGDPYHYVRSTPGSDGQMRLIVGGEDHRTGEHDDAEQRFARLEAWTRERFPSVGAVEYRWSGQVLEPIDALAYIGRNPGGPAHVFIATGDSGHGMTHGAIAGGLLKDLVLNRPNPFRDLYDPARKRIGLSSVKEYLSLAGEVSKHYLEWLKTGTSGSVERLAAGEGVVVQRGRRRIAVSKDEHGALSACSAVCPHLGCIVHWNSEERSWDCPCHGSRFSPAGEVLSGPAVHGLKAVPFDGPHARDPAAERPRVDGQDQAGPQETVGQSGN